MKGYLPADYIGIFFAATNDHFCHDPDTSCELAAQHFQVTGPSQVSQLENTF